MSGRKYTQAMKTIYADCNNVDVDGCPSLNCSARYLT